MTMLAGIVTTCHIVRKYYHYWFSQIGTQRADPTPCTSSICVDSSTVKIRKETEEILGFGLGHGARTNQDHLPRNGERFPRIVVTVTSRDNKSQIQHLGIIKTRRTTIKKSKRQRRKSTFYQSLKKKKLFWREIKSLFGIQYSPKKP